MRDSAERFFNRELSWLEFDRRVLELRARGGRSSSAKFLAIFSRNLDEFFQVRVSEAQDRRGQRDGTPRPDGSPSAQLAAIRERVLELSALAHETFERELRPRCARGDRPRALARALRRGTRGHARPAVRRADLAGADPLGVDPRTRSVRLRARSR
jgi:polyphosphate kinase